MAGDTGHYPTPAASNLTRGWGRRHMTGGGKPLSGPRLLAAPAFVVFHCITRDPVHWGSGKVLSQGRTPWSPVTLLISLCPSPPAQGSPTGSRITSYKGPQSPPPILPDCKKLPLESQLSHNSLLGSYPLPTLLPHSISPQCSPVPWGYRAGVVRILSGLICLMTLSLPPPAPPFPQTCLCPTQHLSSTSGSIS